MGLVLSLTAALAILRNTAVLRYMLRTPGAWDHSSLLVFLSETALPALIAALLLFLLWCAGRRIARRAGIPFDGALAGLPLALGLGLAGTVVFACGLAGRLSLGIGLALASAALAGLPDARRLVEAAARRPRPAGPPPWTAVLLVPLSFCLFHALVNAAAPPVGWDALAYHLAIPRIYLDADAIRGLPWLMHSQWPHLMETLYAVPLALGRESGAALVHAMICAGLVATVFLAGREEGGPAAGWSAAALLAAQPVFLEVASEPHSDGALSFFHLLACLALWRWSKTGERGLLAAAGICSGLAAACKLTGLALGASLTCWLLLDSRRRAGAGGFLFWAALPVAPWYLKTWALAGNPVWPFYSAVFGGRWEPALVAEGLVRTSLWRFPRDLPLLSRYGPQHLLLPAAGLFAAAAGPRGLPPRLKFLFFVTAPLAAVSVRYHEAWRYLIPLAPAVALACGWWCAEACRRPGWRRLLACSALAFGLWPALGLTQSNELFAVLALRSSARPGVPAREVYRARQAPVTDFYRKAAPLVPPDGKILLFREIRGYHLRAAYQFGDPVNQTQIIYDRLGSPEALRAELERQGLTFVLINEANGLYGPNEDYYSARTLALMDSTLARYGRVALRDGPFVLYELTPPAPPRSGSAPAKEGSGRSAGTARRRSRTA